MENHQSMTKEYRKRNSAKSKALKKSKNEVFIEKLKQDKSPRKKQIGSYF